MGDKQILFHDKTCIRTPSEGSRLSSTGNKKSSSRSKQPNMAAAQSMFVHKQASKNRKHSQPAMRQQLVLTVCTNLATSTSHWYHHKQQLLLS
jgi:hypothetical protein